MSGIGSRPPSPTPPSRPKQLALRGWLLDRLETGRYWPEPRLQSARQLADRAQTDADFIQVAELYVGHPGFDAPALVAELVEGESVPLLPVLRYKPSGLRVGADVGPPAPGGCYGCRS